MAAKHKEAAASDDKANRVRALLRQVRFMESGRDIVAAGCVRGIGVKGGCVTIQFAPNTRDQAKVGQMMDKMRKTLGADAEFSEVEIELQRPFTDSDTLSGGGRLSERSRGAAGGGAPGADEWDESMARPDLARGAGYDEDGPKTFSGPRGDAYEGQLRVFQWEINPHDLNAQSGTADLELDGWEFRLWWQHHSERLVYASIQAMYDDSLDHRGAARSHPVGRNEAVNLVYDRDRRAVIAIYGTVQDFRPFVGAFDRAYVQLNESAPNGGGQNKRLNDGE